MNSREIYREWLRGCNDADGSDPWRCDTCTRAMMEAMGRALKLEEEADIQGELENVETANIALRSELVRTTKNLTDAKASICTAAKGMAVIDKKHADSVAALRSQLEASHGQNLSMLGDLHRMRQDILALKREVEGRKEPESPF